MTLPRYPAYKDSGVEWLGEIPEHWAICRIGFISSSGMGQTILKEMLDDSPAEDSLPVYSASAGSSEFGFFRNPDVRLNPGDLIIGARGSIGNSRRVVEASTCTQTTIWIKPERQLINTEFMYWVVVAGRQGLFPYDKTAIPMLTVDQVRSGRVALPTKLEQARISSFLDHETSKIDALIAEQKNLIALLKEKRQAVISHAATKGLDPDVPMRDSGVAWLGEVPEHWAVGPMKRFANVIDCKHVTVQFHNEGWPVVSIRELQNDQIDLTNAKRTSRAEWDFLREGRTPVPYDLIFSRNASVGAVGQVEPGTDFCMGQDVCLIRPGALTKYLYFQLTSDVVRKQIEALLVGATIRRMNVEGIRNLCVAWPNESEQRQIADQLDVQASQMSELIQEAQYSISLLLERRSALISAAVTGKIDVRCRVAEEAA